MVINFSLSAFWLIVLILCLGGLCAFKGPRGLIVKAARNSNRLFWSMLTECKAEWKRQAEEEAKKVKAEAEKTETEAS